MTASQLDQLIEDSSRDLQRPDDSPYRALRYRDSVNIANQTASSQHQVECRALELGIIPDRYSRNQRSLTAAEQLALLNSKVAVIGLGGLGGTVTEILARLGVGHLILVDGDVFDDSNLNRQLLSSPAMLGVAKAKAAATRVLEINPAVTANAHTEFLTEDNSRQLVNGCHLVIDCLDTIGARFVLEAACQEQGIPLISAAVGGTSGQLTVILPGDEGLRLIYGDPAKAPARGAEANRGTFAFTAFAMAAQQCAEATLQLLKKPSTLPGKLLFVDYGDHSRELLILRREKAGL